MSAPRVRAPRSWLRKTLAAAGGAVAALLVTELALRAVGYEPLRDAAGPQGLFVADPIVGVRQASRFSGRHRHFEFDVPVRTDALGLRVPEKTSTRPDGRPVVLSLGDSFAHGYGVAAQDAYAARLERMLGVTVHNAGVSSYGVRQMAATLERVGPALAPDIVLFTFFFANDPQDDSGAPLTARGGVMLSPSLAGAIDASPVYAWSLEWSRLATAACVARVRRKYGLEFPDPLVGPADPTALPTPTGLECMLQAPPPEVLARLDASAQAIAALTERARALGAVPVLLVVPLAWQVDDELWERTAAAHGIHTPGVDRGAIATWAGELAARLELDWLDLAAEFRSVGAGREAFFPHNQHFDAEGHRVAAERIATFLLARGLVEAPAR